MKILNKFLMAIAMVATLSMTPSCNKNKSKSYFAGLPYTYFRLDDLGDNEVCMVRFECKGKPEVYWNSETSSQEKSHTFKKSVDGEEPCVLIKGNVTSIWFADNNGDLLASGNSKIHQIIFSNTITHLPANACANVPVRSAYLPASITSIGKNAFLPYYYDEFVCEPNSRPSGWNANWCTFAELNKYVIWGRSYYIQEDGATYFLIREGSTNSAFYAGNLYEDITTLTIPESITVNGLKFRVMGIFDIGREKKTLVTVNIPKSIRYIANYAFATCEVLTEINFAEKYDEIFIGEFAFDGCYKLVNIELPNGLTRVPRRIFTACSVLQHVKIPGSVRKVDECIFWCGCFDNPVTVDLTDFNNKNDIPLCDRDILDSTNAPLTTFKISSPLEEDDFVSKGWPKTDSTDPYHNVSWEVVV